jgi:hypothetical protein
MVLLTLLLLKMLSLKANFNSLLNNHLLLLAQARTCSASGKDAANAVLHPKLSM